MKEAKVNNLHLINGGHGLVGDDPIYTGKVDGTALSLRCKSENYNFVEKVLFP